MYFIKLILILSFVLFGSYLFDRSLLYLFNIMSYDLSILNEYFDIVYYFVQILSQVFIVLVGYGLFRKELEGVCYEKCFVSKINFLVLVALFISLSFVIGYVSNLLYTLYDQSYLYKESINSTPLFYLNETSIDWSSVFSSLLIFCLIIPVVEEITYRSMLIRVFNFRFSYVISSFFSSAIFSFGHEKILPAFLMGLVLCYVYRKYGLLISILIHVAYNSFTLLYQICYFIAYDRYMFSMSEEGLFPDTNALISFVLLSMYFLWLNSNKIIRILKSDKNLCE